MKSTDIALALCLALMCPLSGYVLAEPRDVWQAGVDCANSAFATLDEEGNPQGSPVDFVREAAQKMNKKPQFSCVQDTPDFGDYDLVMSRDGISARAALQFAPEMPANWSSLADGQDPSTLAATESANRDPKKLTLRSSGPAIGSHQHTVQQCASGTSPCYRNGRSACCPDSGG